MSSSEQETIYRFNSADLPLVSIPSAISSSVQSRDLEEPQLGTDNDFVFRIPTSVFLKHCFLFQIIFFIP